MGIFFPLKNPSLVASIKFKNIDLLLEVNSPAATDPPIAMSVLISKNNLLIFISPIIFRLEQRKNFD